jgi:hypothetical protein
LYLKDVHNSKLFLYDYEKRLTQSLVTAKSSAATNNTLQIKNLIPNEKTNFCSNTKEVRNNPMHESSRQIHAHQMQYIFNDIAKPWLICRIVASVGFGIFLLSSSTLVLKSTPLDIIQNESANNITSRNPAASIRFISNKSKLVDSKLKSSTKTSEKVTGNNKTTLSIRPSNESLTKDPKVIKKIIDAMTSQDSKKDKKVLAPTVKTKVDKSLKPNDINSFSISMKALLFIVFNTTLPIREKAMVFPLPKPNDKDSMALYNPEALQVLSKLKSKIKARKNITLVMSGGSSSAYVPDGNPNDRFFIQFAETYLKSELGAKVDVIDRAHGSRNSIHTAHLMASFFPKREIDIVIWEFSINDGNFAADVRNGFIMWLRNVAAFQSSPPLVILVYLWKSPFTEDDQGKIVCRTFEQHAMLGSEYGFVLGHVNMAAYFDYLGWGFDALNKTFLADRHHPNALTHHIIARFMAHLLSKGPETITPLLNRIPENKTDIEWFCDTNGTEKIQMQQMFAETQGIAKGSFTLDIPRNKEKEHPDMLMPTNFQNLEQVKFGFASQGRVDRQYAAIVPCCNNSSSLDFDLSRFDRIRAIMISMRCTEEIRDRLRVSHDEVFSDTKPNLLRPLNWGCILGGYNMRIGELPSLDVDFLLIDKNISRIGFCDSNCNKSHPIPLVYLSVF